jgi:hypothetical protein
VLLQFDRMEPVHALYEVRLMYLFARSRADHCILAASRSCQHAGNTTADTIGIDAGTGAFGLYLANCGVPMNGSLPANIQTDVCTQQIDIRSTLYDPMWVDPRPDSGAWCVNVQLESSCGRA